MKEELLHYVWKTKNFTKHSLLTTDGEAIQIKSFGFHNQHAGPDFLQAQIKLGNKWWFGHVEIHIYSSDWLSHAHQNDASYDNVILHVVYEHNKEIYRNDGSKIPTLELKDKIPQYLFESYQQIMCQQSWIPCQSHLESDELDVFYFQRHKLFVEKLEWNSMKLHAELKRNGNDWHQLLWFCLARSFGLKINIDAMAELSMKTPVNLLWKLSYQPKLLAALLFGQSGLLAPTDHSDYIQELVTDYNFLKNKYTLIPMNGREWKFMRMRPASFPTVRLALLSALYNQADLHQKILQCQSLHELESVIHAQASEFWDNHYTLFKESKHHSKKLITPQLRDLIIINGIIPYLFTFGQFHSDENMMDRAIRFAQELPAEKNSIIQKWNNLGIEINSAYDSQAMLHLYKNYCVEKKCLNCQYGNKMLQQIGQILQESIEIETLN